MTNLGEITKNIFQYVQDGSESYILPSLSEDFTLDTPLWGRFEGRNGFFDFSSKLRSWLADHKTMVDPFSTIAADDRIVCEYTFFLAIHEANTDLPVAVAADITGGKISSVRIYFSTWPLTGNHTHRPPMLEPDDSLPMPDTVGKYVEYLAGTDAEKISDLFSDSGYIREPSGSKYVHMGKDSLPEFYMEIISDGGIPLRHCTVTTERNATAVEYFFDKWNKYTFPAEAGIAVYVMDDDGKIVAARVYDDARSPSENPA